MSEATPTVLILLLDRRALQSHHIAEQRFNDDWNDLPLRDYCEEFRGASSKSAYSDIVSAAKFTSTTAARKSGFQAGYKHEGGALCTEN